MDEQVVDSDKDPEKANQAIAKGEWEREAKLRRSILFNRALMSLVAKHWMELICTRVSLTPKLILNYVEGDSFRIYFTHWVTDLYWQAGVVIDLTELHHLPTMYIIGNSMLRHFQKLQEQQNQEWICGMIVH
ncbi:hypothetical protein Gotur_005639 [Gossypium turneri]